MAFSRVRLYHFRNLKDRVVPTSAKDVFLVGENGHGKTNFLEAVYFICYGSSFRTRRDDTLICHGESEMAVEAVFQEEDERRILVKQAGRRKEIQIDSNPVKDRKELVSTVPCIVFCHDDISFVTGAPDMQRWFMNQTLSLVDRDYLDHLRRYNRVLQARNAALRAGQINLLDTLDMQLVETGVPVMERRSEINGRFSDILSRLFAEVFGGARSLSLEYRPSWKTDSPAAEINGKRENDIRMSTTTSGPHRDKFIYRFGESLLTETGSTGQLRLVSLILRVAQASFVQETRGRSPVLLLDDVLLELDPRRRARFVATLPEYEQAFFTFLPDEQYSRLGNESTLTYRVEDGVLNEAN